MPKFPVDAPRQGCCGIGRPWVLCGAGGSHISLVRANPDGSRTPMTIPNHPALKSSTLRTICTQAGIARDDFLKAYEQA